jgi:hemerythrin
MALIEWTDELSVNIKEIDLQHRRLIEIINQLHDAMKERKTNEVLQGILESLVNYTEYHFKVEENYFEEFNYIGTAAHTSRHADLVKQVLTFYNDFKLGKISVSIKLMGFLRDWLREHILIEDKKYIRCFHEKGLS